MAGRAVDIQEQWFKIRLKMDIVIGASQPTALAKFGKRNTTCRTGFLIGFRKFLDGFFDFELFGQHPRQSGHGPGFGILRQVGSRVVLAQVQAGRAFGIGQLRDMKGSRLLAMLAFHKFCCSMKKALGMTLVTTRSIIRSPEIP
jgi:hypothetical protein